jgi:hypothetical protein
LLDDIRAHAGLITREIYVSYDGTRYDPNLWQNDPQLNGNKDTESWGLQAPGLNNYLRSFHRHEVFDRFSGSPMSQRSRSDLIKQSVFDHLDKLLDESGAQNLRKLANKFIAHAADMKI